MQLKVLFRRLLPVLAVGLLAGGGAAQAAEALSEEAETRVRNSLKVLLPNITPDSVRPTPVPGLVEVVFGPRLVYITDDGRFLLQGNVIDLERRENLTEGRVAEAKAKAIEAVGESNMIVFGPDNAKHTVTVFTDIDCAYCRKLHAEMDQYNDAGIRVRYLYFPRAGLESESYWKAVATWCADDRQQAMTDAKSGNAIDMKRCENPVESHYRLGAQMGVQGTPAIVTADGQVVPGYVPANKLRDALDQNSLAGGPR